MYKYIPKIKTEHKILSITFLLIFITFIFFHIKYKLGLFFDQPTMFLTGFCNLDENLNGIFFFRDQKIRFFNNFLVAIPFNIEWFIYKKIVNNINILTLLNLFTSSYFIVQLLGIIVNFIVSLRTKRYDIAVIAFAFYCIFCISGAIWAVREINITVLFYFALLSYFLSEQKLCKWDVLPISLLVIYMFESFETSIIYNFILILFVILYNKKPNEYNNIKIKRYIAICGFMSIFYIITKILKNINHLISGGIEEWINQIYLYITCSLNTNILISIFGIILIIFSLFYKKIFNKRSIIPIIIYMVISGYILWKKTFFFSGEICEMANNGGTLLFIFPVITTILILDYLKINIKEKNSAFFHNLFIIACIIGISNLIWQINTCFTFDKYVSSLKNIIKNSNEHIRKLSEEELNDATLNLGFYNDFGIVHQSILLNDTNIIKKIIVPNDDNEWLSDSLFEVGDDYIKLQSTFFEYKHKKYFDFSEIIKDIEDYKKSKEIN